MSDDGNTSDLGLASKATIINKSGTGSGKGARFAWTDTTDKILLVALLGDNKIGAEGWAAASKALETQGFLNSEGKAVNPSAIQQHFSKLRASTSLLRGDTVDVPSDLAGGSSASPITPKKRGRPSTKTPEQKAAAAAETARKKAEKAAEKDGGGTPGKRGPGRPKKSAATVKTEVADMEDATGEKTVGDEEGEMDIDDSNPLLTKRRKAERAANGGLDTEVA